MREFDERRIPSILDADFLVNKGGPGSGNFGHAGRPGERGGSAGSGSGGSDAPSKGGHLLAPHITPFDTSTQEIRSSLTAANRAYYDVKDKIGEYQQGVIENKLDRIYEIANTSGFDVDRARAQKLNELFNDVYVQVNRARSK